MTATLKSHGPTLRLLSQFVTQTLPSPSHSPPSQPSSSFSSFLSKPNRLILTHHLVKNDRAIELPTSQTFIH